MDFELTDEQKMLRESARRFLKSEWALDSLRQMEKEDIDYDPDLYRKMAALGWLGVLIPEEYGGSGGSWTDAAILFEEFGRALLRVPHFETFLAGQVILRLGNEELKRAVLPKLIQGEVIITVSGSEPEPETGVLPMQASREDGHYSIKGTKLFVKYARGANYILMPAEVVQDACTKRVFLVPLEGAAVSHRIMHSFSGERLAEVTLTGVRVPETDAMPISSLDEDFQSILFKAQVLRCAEILGGASAALEMAVEYSKQRIQFGVPIGSFQALQHKMADIWMGIHKARWLTYHWSWLLDRGADSQQVGSMSQLVTKQAYRRAVEDAVQIHGGYGVMQDLDIGLYYKAAKVFELQMAPSWVHKEKVAQNLGL